MLRLHMAHEARACEVIEKERTIVLGLWAKGIVSFPGTIVAEGVVDIEQASRRLSVIRF